MFYSPMKISYISFVSHVISKSLTFIKLSIILFNQHLKIILNDKVKHTLLFQFHYFHHCWNFHISSGFFIRSFVVTLILLHNTTTLNLFFTFLQTFNMIKTMNKFLKMFYESCHSEVISLLTTFTCGPFTMN